MEYCILVINPGSTSTKIAVFQGAKVLLQQNIRHSGEELAPYAAIMDQAPFRPVSYTHLDVYKRQAQ